MPTPMTYHTGPRGVLGFLKYITGSDNVSRGGVVPAVALVDSDGNPAGGGTQASPTVVTDSSVEYETVAASQTGQVLGAIGATGDRFEGLLIIPATTSPGLVTILDNAISIPVFVGGATSVSNLVPFYVYLGVNSLSGAWKITTGANVSVVATGNFT